MDDGSARRRSQSLVSAAQLTSLRVDPNARLVRATDADLAEYPFLFAAAPGAMGLTSDEIVGPAGLVFSGAAHRASALSDGCADSRETSGAQYPHRPENSEHADSSPGHLRC